MNTKHSNVPSELDASILLNRLYCREESRKHLKRIPNPVISHLDIMHVYIEDPPHQVGTSPSSHWQIDKASLGRVAKTRQRLGRIPVIAENSVLKSLI